MPAKTKITIQTTHGPREVNAEVLGDYGIHRSTSGHDYTVTHIPSGRRVARLAQVSSAEELMHDLVAAKIAWPKPPVPLSHPGFHIVEEIVERLERP